MDEAPVSAHPPTGPDAALVQRLLEGDDAAFSALVDAHHDTLRRVVRTWVRREDLADEVVQDTWMAILSALPRFEGRSSLRTWMFRILANIARTRARKEHREVPVSSVVDPDDVGVELFDQKGAWHEPPVQWTDPRRSTQDRELREQIEAAIRELPERQQLIITLRDVKGWTSDEVCNAMEITETNQRVLLHRARTRVRASLASYLNGVS